MYKKIFSLITLIGILIMAPNSWAVKNDSAAPDFSAKASDGKTYSLAQLKGKIVVLEWLNPGCPFVKKHYNTKLKNMQTLQEKYTANPNIVWLSVASSAPGKQGHLSAAEAEAFRKEFGSHATAILLDGDSKIAKLYGAKTTPHMFIIDREGKLRYQGAIDSISSADVEDIAKAKNYVASALDQLTDTKRASQPLAEASTTPYGCSVKY